MKLVQYPVQAYHNNHREKEEYRSALPSFGADPETGEEREHGKGREMRQFVHPHQGRQGHRQRGTAGKIQNKQRHKNGRHTPENGSSIHSYSC